jgi:hypothetical protein
MVLHIPIEVAVNVFADLVCEEILMQIAVYLALKPSVEIAMDEVVQHALGVIAHFPMDLAVTTPMQVALYLAGQSLASAMDACRCQRICRSNYPLLKMIMMLLLDGMKRRRWTDKIDCPCWSERDLCLLVLLSPQRIAGCYIQIIVR